MARRGLCVAFVVYGTMDISGILALADRVGSIVIPVSDERQDVVALAGLLNACRNINYLFVRRRSISGLAALLDGRLPHVQRIFLNTLPSPGFRGQELVALLMHMPGLRHVSSLPRLSEALQGPENFHLEHIDIAIGHWIALPLLLTRRWTARSVDIRISRASWQCIESVDWTAVGALPEIATLCLHIEQSRENGPAPALSFITACSALRVLQLGASVAEISVLLPLVFNSCRGLRRLELYLKDVAMQPDDTVAFAALGTHAIRKLHALRTLEIHVYRNTHLLEDLVLFCRQRRIACRVKSATGR